MKRDYRRLRPGSFFAFLMGAVISLVVCPAMLPAGSAMNYQVPGGRTGATPRPAPKRRPRPKPRATPRPAQTATTRLSRPSFTENIRGVPLEMVLIPAGSFTMGSPDSEDGRERDEGPPHHVTVQQFYMGKYEVTQAQYRALMGMNPSNFKGDNLPVESLSWIEAVEFCRKLSQKTGRKYRLPTESEWEYACRAGTTTPFAFGSSLSSEQANSDGLFPYGGAAQGVSSKQTTPVGSFQPNAFGLYDMHGNVWELCQDWYHENYDGAPTDGSAWEIRGTQLKRVLRGGSWINYASHLRSAVRGKGHPASPHYHIGFRVVTASRS